MRGKAMAMAMAMAPGAGGYVRASSWRWWCTVMFALMAVCSSAARNTISTSVEGVKTAEVTRMEIKGRSLMVSLDDYGPPSANQGHEPGSRIGKPPKKRYF